MLRIFIFAALAGFAVTGILTPVFIRLFNSIELQVKDLHKPGKPLVARTAGLPVLAGIFAGIMLFIFVQIFKYNMRNSVLVPVFAAMTTLMIITFVGFMDDISIRFDPESGNYYSKLRQWHKPLLTLPAAIPLMVILAGDYTMSIPFLGAVDFGLIYPFLLIPIGVVGAANMVNLLEGLNGSGSGMGIIYTGMLGLYALVNHRYSATIIAFSTFGALLALWKFHKTPAKVLAGDSLTYLLGGVIACIAIVGNIETAAVVVSIPFFIEFFLKSRGMFRKSTVGTVDRQGRLHSKYKRIYSIPHIWMRTGRFTERQIVYRLMIMELIFASFVWLIPG